jgi:hypothetical protein
MRADISGNGPIEFESRVLPHGAKYFDLAPFYKELSPETKRWVCDLGHAWGRERSASSDLVLRACDELENRIHAERASILAHFSKAFPQNDPADLCENWLSAIMTMRECAEQRDECVWTMHPQEGEVANSLGTTIRIVKTMIATQNTKRSPDDQIPMPMILEVIKSRPEDEQITYINSIMDALSDEEGY